MKRGSRQGRPPRRPVLGLEAEFTLLIDGKTRRPEDVFGSPQKLVRSRMLPRIGRSFQLPSGGAIYFDTGVIEVATPIVEVELGCCFRVARLLWEQIRFVRRELRAWARANHCRASLQGFSAHYNFSFPEQRRSRERTPAAFAELLARVALVPTILLAANRASTAVGVRPRGRRVEITCDFTPDAALMLATCAFLAGVVETALAWADYRPTNLQLRQLPELSRYRLRKHSSRRGRRILADSLSADPFLSSPNEPIWKLRDGRVVSLRQFSSETLPIFEREIVRLSDRETLRYIESVFAGDARSLLDFSERPSSYDDAGKDASWDRRRTRKWSRSAYERVIHRVIRGEPITIGGRRYVAQRMLGWYEIAFRELKTGRLRVFNLDDLAARRRRS